MLPMSFFSFNDVFSSFKYMYNFCQLPNDKILDLSKLIGFADDRINAAHLTSSVIDRIGNIVGKRKNASYQHNPFFS